MHTPNLVGGRRRSHNAIHAAPFVSWLLVSIIISAILRLVVLWWHLALLGDDLFLLLAIEGQHAPDDGVG